MNRWSVIIWALLFFPFIRANAQNISNEGTDFWAVFPTHDPSAGSSLANIRIWITSKTGSTVTVSCGGYSEKKDIPANNPVEFNVTRDQSYIDYNERNSNLSGRAIHIKVDEGDKVAVYAHIFAGFRSAASLILPVESLGQKYYSMNYTQDVRGGNIAQNFLVIVAAQPNTQILVKEKTGAIRSINLANQGDVYEYMPGDNSDITGASVYIDPSSPDNCNKRIAVFSGSTSISIGCNTSRDPLFQQLYPTISWGKEYGVVPFMNRKYILRILAQENNTNVQFNGQSLTLMEGEHFESQQLTEPVFISADKQISVAQYSLTQNCSAANGGGLPGDPEMVMLNPVEFNVKAVTLFSSTDQAIANRYINVSIKTSAVHSFMINGVAPVGWRVIPDRPDYSCIQVEISDKVSYLTANQGFNAVAYGFGQTESYAYSAGTNLAASNYLLVHNRATNIDAPNACIDQPSDFKITLPYKALKITWKLDDEGSVDYTPEPEISNGSTGTLYTYTYVREISFSQLETHRMQVKAQMPNLDNCLGAEIEYNFNFDVYPIPKSAFLVDSEVCPDTEIQFTDESLSNLPDKPINKWLWDFGDGNISREQHPKHIFSSSGIFEVKLSAGLDEGCMSDPETFSVSVRPKINAAINAPVKGCINNEITFADASSSAAGPMVSWLWDFGDGNTSTAQHPKHTFVQTGPFSVTLITKTANGCQSLPVKLDIIIYDLPIVKFSLPKVCVGDDVAFFENNTTNEDQTITGLTYSWNFGDAFATAVNNTSFQRDGRHKYSRAGNYIVSLTVTNANGCSYTQNQSFTVNGSQIIPVFEVLNKDKLCSGSKITVKNSSTIDEGRIIKLVWYIDDVEKLVVDDPDLVGTYLLDAPVATDAKDKLINIKLIAFSGLKCQEPLVQQVIVHATPALVFDPVDPVCLNAGIFRLTNARETLGLAGHPVYSGAGIINADGDFNPVIAGVGTHTLTARFLTATGCEEISTQTITVNPIPDLIIDRDIYILAGGEKKVNATATGIGLTYKWSPATGLSSDDVLEPVMSGDVDRVYTLTISSSQSCVISERITLHVLQLIQAPNAFSPNGDGINDTWVLKYIDTYPGATIDVFNRYGEKVFHSVGYSNPFDGNFKNEALPVGTYYYIINPRNGRKNVTGSLTLIR
ncbi:PKD domain-containing protein [Pedobacter frigoris]|uniref:PKD domain-containing protein n=1 Tax=Pedobacter frigoris TaxID=2571272 RepID=A0A4U1CMC0_9SPHI|nr:PKD domain-containing protein [Pedobacter frigoris]TKC09017.1 PKD domain-containing protein [Pedobacter frigoris]